MALTPKTRDYCFILAKGQPPVRDEYPTVGDSRFVSIAHLKWLRMCMVGIVDAAYSAKEVDNQGRLNVSEAWATRLFEDASPTGRIDLGSLASRLSIWGGDLLPQDWRNDFRRVVIEEINRHPKLPSYRHHYMWVRAWAAMYVEAGRP